MLAIAAPAERSLGNFVKLIYVHAAVNWSGMMLLGLAGALGVAYLLTRNAIIFNWLRALQLAVIIIWTFHTILGAISMRIIWNEFVWAEPRMFFALAVLIVIVGGYLISLAGESETITAVANIVAVVIVFVLGLLLATRNILHPKAAIVGSPDLAIKLFAFLITLSFLGSGLGLTCLLHKDTKA